MGDFNFAGTSASGLFKFRPYETEVHRERVKAILLNGHLRFSTMRSFNDPFEGKSRLVGRFGPKQLSKELAKVAVRKAREAGMRFRDRLEVSNRVRNRNPQQALKLLTEKHQQRMSDECLVYSMSEHRTHPLQWAHYADGHSGICIRFNNKVRPFDGAMQVMYDNEYPGVPYPFAGPASYRELLKKAALAKAAWWSYESEYRLVSVRMGNKSWNLGLDWLTDGQTAVVDPLAITSVTLGAKISEQGAADIRAFCEAHRPDIAIERATVAADRYELRFEKFD